MEVKMYPLYSHVVLIACNDGNPVINIDNTSYGVLFDNNGIDHLLDGDEYFEDSILSDCRNHRHIIWSQQ